MDELDGEVGQVGLVVVSHSVELARGAAALAAQMVGAAGPRIEVAAGLADGTLGTDAVAIREAIARADGPRGVVVLMDLGSAVLSAELALDLIEDSALRERVTLSPAPIVEGLVVAAVTAAGGADRAEVAAEAEAALRAKKEHLEPAETVARQGLEGEAPATEGTEGTEVVGTFRVVNPHGLHARPAARLVTEARRLDALVRLRNLTNGRGPVPATSLSRVATLAARAGHEIEARATGPGAGRAVERLVTLAAEGFGEATPPVPATGRGFRPASPGVVVGPARHLVVPDLDPDTDPDADSGERHFADALAAVRTELEALRSAATGDVAAEDAGIFDAHLALLDDEEILADVQRRIDDGTRAPRAWADALDDVARTWAELPDDYLRERAGDVRSIRDQVLRALLGVPAPSVSGPGVVLARDLSPADLAALDPVVLQGIVLAEGSPTSHAAILARGRGIPLVVDTGREVLTVPEGTLVAMDGVTGEVVIDPSAEVVAKFEARRSARAREDATHLAVAAEPAVTVDGVAVAVTANLGSVEDARIAARSGADGSGLVRTEFLFLGRDRAPSVEEQVRAYAEIAETLAGQPVSLRTLDLGGDKPLPFAGTPVESNPFLGVRGLRLALAEAALLREQLAAVCAVARRHPVKVMFPMVSVVDELLEAREVLAEVAGPEGIPPSLRVGIMVEVPAAALRLATFLPHLDFVSIGTNDLTQYVMAAERGHPGLARLADALDPAVLRLVDEICRVAGDPVPVSVCGEVASDVLAVPVLIGLGVRELSVAPAAVPQTKAVVRTLSAARCRALGQAALGAADAHAVRESARAELSAAGWNRWS